MSFKICEHCLESHQSWVNYCPNCGNPLVDSASKEGIVAGKEIVKMNAVENREVESGSKV